MLVPLTLARIAEVVGGQVAGSAVVDSVSIDSRSVEPGGLFVALRGEVHDGHAFLADVRSAGAAAVLVSDPRSVPEGMPFVVVPDPVDALSKLASEVRSHFNGPVVGITGSVGKTSTKELAALVLEAGFQVHSTPGNRNNEIGLPLTILAAPENARLLVLEMGMRGLGQIKQLCEIAQPTIGIVTGIGVSHIELLGSRERIADAKSELLEGLPKNGTAIYPSDDLFSTRLLAASGHCSRLTVGMETAADVMASELDRQRDGWRFTVQSPWGKTKCFLPSPARFLVKNSLFALAAAGVCGVDLGSAARMLSRYAPPKGRLCQRRGRTGASVIDDTYNAAPESMVAALEVLAQSPVPSGGARIAVLGEMRELGAFSAEGHGQVGAAVARLMPDMVVLVGEGARRIESSARIAGFPSDRIHWFAEARDAAALLPAVVSPHDVVLAKGSRAVGLEAVVDVLCASEDGNPG
jgi:UDP-N-acetylmuramoyl-tripeptide--D-alanyl-D-alanine ligase